MKNTTTITNAVSAALAAVAVLCVMTAKAKPVEACSYTPIVSVNEDLSEGLTGIPVSGVVPIYAHVSSDEPSEQPSLTVQTLEGAPIAGSLDKGRFRLFWRSDAPLAPNSTYQATLTGAENGPIVFSFTTAGDSQVPALQFTLGEQYLGEFHRSEQQTCCYTDAESSCGGAWLECWTRSAITEVDFYAQFSIEQEIARYYLLEGEALEGVNAHTTISTITEGGISAAFTERADEYCAAVHVRSLVDGAQTTETFCQSGDALVKAAPFKPEEPKYDTCAEPPFDLETGEEIAIDSEMNPATGDGDCSTSGRSSGLFFSFLVLIGFMGRRRRVAFARSRNNT